MVGVGLDNRVGLCTRVFETMVMTSGNVVACCSTTPSLVLASHLISMGTLEEPGLVLLLFVGVDNL